jgi:RND family efflux transporter MFP subunit
MPPPAVDVVTLKPAEVVDSTEYLGTLRSRTAASVQPQVAGQITEILVHPGDVVAPDQPLVAIDPGRQPAAVAQARANEVAARASLALANENLARTQRLVDTGALPRQELDTARAAADAARAQYAAQGAMIRGSQVELHYYKVVSPAAGTVGDIPARVGDTVTPQTHLTTVTDNTTLEANIAVPVERAKDIRPTTRIDIVDEAGKVIGSGTAKFVSPDVDAETQSVLVKADIANPDRRLRSDQRVRARVVWDAHPGLTVPALAVSRIGGQSFVYVAQGGAVHQRPIELGDLIDNAYVVVKGLNPGERIATSNLQKLRDGAPIQPKG